MFDIWPVLFGTRGAFAYSSTNSVELAEDTWGE
jgi:hypothetical protein